MATLLSNKLPVPLRKLGNTDEGTRQIACPPRKQTNQVTLQRRFGTEPGKNNARKGGCDFYFWLVISRGVVHKIWE